jgi:hypothetical protein
MKTLFLICCLVSFSGIGQTLNRQLYTNYFKRLYTYEPSMIRENKIESLEVISTHKTGDSIISQEIKEKASFRKDGRPIQLITWDEYHRESMITNYSYDSLGNLVEYRCWVPKYSQHDENKELEQVFFHYEAERLTKVFSYSMKNGDNYSTLNYCDTLSYDPKQTKVSILRGNATGSKILFTSTPQFIYPVFATGNKQFTSTEKDLASKPVDKEMCWQKSCIYSNSVMKEIQRLTGRTCLNEVIVNGCLSLRALHFSKAEVEKPKQPSQLIDDQSNVDYFYIDTLEQKLVIQSSNTFSQPTSLEDMITSTTSTQQYDYSLRLLQVDEVRNCSRGQREHSNNSSQTFYTYFDFGLLKRKLKFQYWNNNAYNQIEIIKNESEQEPSKVNPAMIYEEKVEIKTWN